MCCDTSCVKYDVRGVRTPTYAEVPGSNHCQDSSSLDSGFRNSFDSIQAIAGMVNHIGPPTVPLTHLVKFRANITYIHILSYKWIFSIKSMTFCARNSLRISPAAQKSTDYIIT